MQRVSWRLAVAAWALLGVGGLLPSAACAETRQRVFRFAAPLEGVDGYRFYLFDPHAKHERVFDAGPVHPGPDGIRSVPLTLAAGRTYLVEMTAYNATGESPRSNTLTVTGAPDPALRVDAIASSGLERGRLTLRLEGAGLTAKPGVRWENGEGRPPKTRYVRVLDARTLEVGVKVRARRLGPSLWDLRLVMRDGREVVAVGALQLL